MKNSKFNPLFESVFKRLTTGSGFLAGDVVKFKSDHKTLDCYKGLSDNVKQCIEEMIKTGNNIRVGRLHNNKFSNSYGAMGGTEAPADLADCYEEVAPSFWRNLVTVPIGCLETANPEFDLPPVPEGQKDNRRLTPKPTETKKDKPNKGKEIDEQTKVGKKQNMAPKGDYELATKNTELEHSNKYNDSKPSKVKNLEIAKELKETIEDRYVSMIKEDAEGTGVFNMAPEDVGAMGSGSNMEDASVKKHMSIDEFAEKYSSHIEDQEEILARDNPSLSRDELTGQAAQIVAAKVGVEIIDDSMQSNS